MWCEVWSKQKVERKVMMNVSRLFFVFTWNSNNEVQRDSIDRPSAACDRPTQGLYLFPFERKAADKKMKKPNRISTSVWTRIDGNRNEAEFDDTTNMFLRDSLKQKESP